MHVLRAREQRRFLSLSFSLPFAIVINQSINLSFNHRTFVSIRNGRILRFSRSFLLAFQLILLDAVFIRHRGCPITSRFSVHADAEIFLTLLGTWPALPQAFRAVRVLQSYTFDPPRCVTNLKQTKWT